MNRKCEKCGKVMEFYGVFCGMPIYLECDCSPSRWKNDSMKFLTYEDFCEDQRLSRLRTPEEGGERRC